MEINLIVATSLNGVIGKENKMPWHYPEDLKYFKSITENHYVIMGRKTFESIGKPLKNRINLVLSKTLEREGEELVFDNTYDLLLWLANQEILYPYRKLKAFVIGGEKIYKEFLNQKKINKIYQTVIKERHEGDKFFHLSPDENYQLIKKQESAKLSFLVYSLDSSSNSILSST